MAVALIKNWRFFMADHRSVQDSNKFFDKLEGAEGKCSQKISLHIFQSIIYHLPRWGMCGSKIINVLRETSGDLKLELWRLL